MLIAVVCMLQALFVGIAFWSIDTKALFESERESLTQLLNVVNQDLESRVEAINSIALDVVISSGIKGNLNMTSSLDLGRAKGEVNSILSKKVLSSYRELLDLSIIDLKGNTYSTRASYFLPPDFRLEDTEVFRKVEPANGALVWLDRNEIIDRFSGDSFWASTRLSGLRAAALIKDYTRGTVLGLLMVSVKDDFFSGIDYSNSSLKNVSLYMVSPDAARILPVAGLGGGPGWEVVERLDPAADRGEFIMRDKAKTIVSYIHNEAMGWTLVSTTPSANISGSFAFIIKTLVATLAFSLVASMLVSWLFTNVVTSGIEDLAAKMRLVEQGDFEVQVGSSRRDEIGWLSTVFDQMVTRIKELIDNTYKQRLLTQEAEFKALQAQINPHFLYNTLDMINWRLLANGQEDISRSVVGLGTILQYSLSAEAVVRLDQEIESVEAYLALRKSNKDPDFSYSVSVECGGGLRLPKLTLQPIVENSIVHGFGRRRSGNEMRIRAYPAGDEAFRIEIADNGIGMDEETLASIWEPSSGVGEEKGAAKAHIGLRNVDERIKYLYGRSFGIGISSQFGFGTLVSIALPLPARAEEDPGERKGGEPCAS